MTFKDLAKQRYSCRKFSDQPVEASKLDVILTAAQAAPTAKNNQPYKLWVIETAGAKKKVGETTKFTFGAPVFIAVGAKADEAFVRPFDEKNYADIDASIVATHIMLAVQDLGLGTTWVGMFDQAKLKEFFPDMKDYEMIALFPIGYPAADAEPSPRHTVRKDRKDTVVKL